MSCQCSQMRYCLSFLFLISILLLWIIPANANDIDFSEDIAAKFKPNGTLTWEASSRSNVDYYDMIVYHYITSLINGDVILAAYIPDYIGLYEYSSTGEELGATSIEGMEMADIAAGPDGSFYLAGVRNSRFYTLAYESGPTFSWGRFYGDDESGHAYDLEIDEDGDLYVAGYASIVSYQGNDFLLVKYDRDGNEIWSASYNGPVYNSDMAYALVVDENENVYVTGKSHGGATSFDYATIKYNSAGEQQWAARYDGNGQFDLATSIAVNQSGEVFVSGESYGEAGYDFLTIKYDADGNQLWTARYEQPDTSTSSISTSTIADNTGVVYVAGIKDVEPYSINIIKYSNAGDLLWELSVDQLCFHRPDIIFDPDGNIVIIANSEFGFDKYDSDGNLLLHGHGSSQPPIDRSTSGIFIDDSGNVYLAGFGWDHTGGGDDEDDEYPDDESDDEDDEDDEGDESGDDDDSDDSWCG